jgi:hypothetical protein
VNLTQLVKGLIRTKDYNLSVLSIKEFCQEMVFGLELQHQLFSWCGGEFNLST